MEAHLDQPSSQSASGLRVVIADGSLLIRDGLVRILRERGVDVVGVARSETEAVTLACGMAPDVVVLDVKLAPSYTNEGVRAAEAIRRHQTGVGILILAGAAEAVHVRRLLSGVVYGVGYVLKDRVTDWDQFAHALITVAAGGVTLDPQVVELVREGPDPVPEGRLTQLSDREHAVLALIAEGLTNRGIADRMQLSVRTVESHVNAIFAKLALRHDAHGHRRVQAAIAYLTLRAT